MAVMSANSLPAFAQTFQSVKRFSVDSIALKPDRPIDKIDRAYEASQWGLLVASGLDLSTTFIALKFNHDVEAGPMRVFGRRNAFAVTIANGATNYGIHLISQRLYRRGGRLRAVAAAISTTRAVGITRDAFNNINCIRRH
jgi:hypothetical protein